MDRESKDFCTKITDLLNIKFHDFLTDVYANSGMSVEGLKKYLEFETNKVCLTWDNIDREGIVRTPFMLFTSYFEACYTAIGEHTSNVFDSINKYLQDDDLNIAIYTQMMEVYLESWKAIKSGQTNIDLTKSTHVLQELVKNQQRPLL